LAWAGGAVLPAAAEASAEEIPGLFTPLTAITPIIAVARKTIRPTTMPKAVLAAGPMAGLPQDACPGATSGYRFGQPPARCRPTVVP